MLVAGRNYKCETDDNNYYNKTKNEKKGLLYNSVIHCNHRKTNNITYFKLKHKKDISNNKLHCVHHRMQRYYNSSGERLDFKKKVVDFKDKS